MRDEEPRPVSPNPALPNSASCCIFTDRSVLRVTGEDRVSFLQGLITNDMEALANGQARFAALLSPQGKILFDFFVIAHAEALLIDTWTGVSADLIEKAHVLQVARQGQDRGCVF